MNCIGLMGLGGLVYGYPWGPLGYIINMSSLSHAMHVYVLGRHVHCINHFKIVMF
jgi:hypothetical protein